MAITIFKYGNPPNDPSWWPYFVLRNDKIHVRVNQWGNFVIFPNKDIAIQQAVNSFFSIDIGKRYQEDDLSWIEFKPKDIEECCCCNKKVKISTR